MKIGFSFGRCVRDIVTGVVDINDVIVIVARTRVDCLEDWNHVVQQYHAYGPLRGLDQDRCIEVAYALYNSGKIHQPRLFKEMCMSVDEDFVWMDLAPTAQHDNPAVQDAWQQYQMMLRLVTDNMPDAAQADTVKTLSSHNLKGI